MSGKRFKKNSLKDKISLKLFKMFKPFKRRRNRNSGNGLNDLNVLNEFELRERKAFSDCRN